MNLNKCFIGGNLTRDPELKHLQSGQSVCKFSIASNRTWLDKDKNKQEEATFFDCVAWGKTGENIAKFFLDILIVALHERITQFESLLYRVRTKTFESLFLIPWALDAKSVLHIQ